jgi:hypothetical protein
MQLACSNNLGHNTLLDVSPSLDGSTKLSRLRNDDQYEADSWGLGLTVRIRLPGPELQVPLLSKTTSLVRNTTYHCL